MTSSMVCAFTHAPLTRYSSGAEGLNVSMYKSCTSAPLFVNPQAILSLCPMTTSGAPGRVSPFTFHPGAVKCSSYQIEGTESSRCVSLASSGFPEAVCAPLTPQLLLPSPRRISLSAVRKNSCTDGNSCAAADMASGDTDSDSGADNADVRSTRARGSSKGRAKVCGKACREGRAVSGAA